VESDNPVARRHHLAEPDPRATHPSRWFHRSERIEIEEPDVRSDRRTRFLPPHSFIAANLERGSVFAARLGRRDRVTLSVYDLRTSNRPDEHRPLVPLAPIGSRVGRPARFVELLCVARPVAADAAGKNLEARGIRARDLALERIDPSIVAREVEAERSKRTW